MNRLNKTFHNNDVLDAQELNDIVGKTNELVDAANTASAVTGIAVTGVEGEETEDGFVVSVSKKDGDSTFTIPTSETMTSAGLMTLDDKAKLDSIGEGASKEILPYDGDAIGVVVVDIYVNAPDGVYWNGTRFVAKKGNSYYSGWNDEEGEYVNANDYQENGLVKMDKVFYNKSNGDRKVTKTGTNLESLGSDVDLSAYLTKVEAQSTYAGKYAATAAYDGLMSAADKAKLDDIDGWTHEALHIAAFVENITPESVSPAGPAQDICFDSVRNSFYWRLYNRLIPIEQQEVKYALSTTADGSLNAYNKDGQWFTMGDRCFVWFSTGFREVLAANLEDYVKKSRVKDGCTSNIGYGEDAYQGPKMHQDYGDGSEALMMLDEDGVYLKTTEARSIYIEAGESEGIVSLKGMNVTVNNKPIANTDVATTEKKGLMSAEDKVILGTIRQKYINAGATYDASTGYYSLNGLTDITEEQMAVIYEDTYRKQCGKDLSYIFYGSNARTNFRARNRLDFNTNLTCLDLCYCRLMEVFYWGREYDSSQSENYYGTIATATEMFNGCIALHTIIGVLNLSPITSKPTSMFANCNALENVQILGLKTSLDLQSPVISHDSLMFLIEHAANTSSITVKVAQSVWGKINSVEWDDIYTAAQAKNISFAY